MCTRPTLLPLTVCTLVATVTLLALITWVPAVTLPFLFHAEVARLAVVEKYKIEVGVKKAVQKSTEVSINCVIGAA